MVMTVLNQGKGHRVAKEDSVWPERGATRKAQVAGHVLMAPISCGGGERFQPREWHRIVWPEGAE